MKKNKDFQAEIEEIFNSLDETKRATPQPFLLTRIMARLNAEKETSLEKAGRLFSRPSFAVVGLFIVIFLNLMVIAFNHHTQNNAGEEQVSFATTGDFSSANTTINEIVNTEP